MTRIARTGTLLALALIAALALAGPASAGKPPHRHGKGAHHRGAHTVPKGWAKHAKVRGAKGDPDGDGLTNWGEYRSHTRPKRADSDRDGIGDADEDYDRDGLDNGSEEDAGTDPGVKDSDRDGVGDADEDADRDGLSNAAEDRTGSDPRDRDSDGDGIFDGAEHAGTVSAFDGTTLTIALAVGGTLSGAVDEDTDVSCDDELGFEDDPSSDDGADNGAGDALTARISQDGGGCIAAMVPGAGVHAAEVEDGAFVSVDLVTAGG